jgi:calcineurin-like phosphoesterase family protein
MHEEYQDSKNESYAQMYKDAVERYKAVAMEGKIVEASFKCVVDEY